MSQYYGYNGPSRGWPWHYVIGAIIAVVGLITYFSRTTVNPVTGQKQRVALSPQQEVQLGLQSAPQMAAEMGGEEPDNDPRTQEVRRVGMNVVQNSKAGTSQYKFQFHLLHDLQTVNAFALPGGQVFITRGLLDRLTNEGQLAGVLGHESGHVVARHSSEQMAKSQLMQSLVMAVGVAASDRDNPGRGYSAAMIAQVVTQMKTLQYSREDESQADALGLEFMSEAGYDPRAMIEVMQVLEQVTPKTGRQPEFLVTHPYPEHRIDDINRWIGQNFAGGVSASLNRGRLLREGVQVGGTPARSDERDKW